MMQPYDEQAFEGRAPEPPRDRELEALARATDELRAAKERVQREAEGMAERTRLDLVEQLLPIADDLDRAVKAAAGEADSGLLRGVSLVREQLAGVLTGYGLERFEPRGLSFDPRQHEAMSVVEVTTPELDSKVVGVMQPGYRVGERVLRPARVQVGRYTGSRRAREPLRA